MSEEKDLNRDIIDGKIIEWNNLSSEELKKMKEEYKNKEKELLKKINEELEPDEDDLSL